jgi:hypothetical protein
MCLERPVVEDAEAKMCGNKSVSGDKVNEVEVESGEWTYSWEKKYERKDMGYNSDVVCNRWWKIKQ